MALLYAHHRDPWSAALSVAANRASKVALLRGSGWAEFAQRNQARLDRDCDAFLAAHPDHPPRFAVALREAATP